MTERRPPRLALALLERFTSESEALAGDLVEAFAAHPSAIWFWGQVLGAVATAAWATRSGEIRPLRLVDDLQPADAIERTRRFGLRFPAVNITASPLAGIGGLGLAIFAGLVTLFTPAAWWALAAAAFAGCVLSGVLIAVRDHEPIPPITLR